LVTNIVTSILIGVISRATNGDPVLNDTRSYKSPSREQGKTETRTAILSAVVKVILEQGIHAFTMDNVAEAAGVAHRTVYRHFESREALLEGLQEVIQEQADRVGLSPPEDLRTAVEFVGALFEEFYRMSDAMHASVIAATALGYQTRQQREGFSYLQRLLAAHFVHLSEAEIREAAAIFRSTISRYNWYVLAVDLQLPAAEAARAVSWAVRVLMQDLERRNLASSKRRGPRPRMSPKRSTQAKDRR
jgi:AcrR family transcriptional regulator